MMGYVLGGTKVKIGIFVTPLEFHLRYLGFFADFLNPTMSVPDIKWIAFI